ncbi:hypothetical protein IT396_01095 [Candidatus Nomurabacteria bacterium]|nr:hypothetical protein [Candidatus Nomurabacteria bacterium]
MFLPYEDRSWGEPLPERKRGSRWITGSQTVVLAIALGMAFYSGALAQMYDMLGRPSETPYLVCEFCLYIAVLFFLIFIGINHLERWVHRIPFKPGA